MVPLRRVYYASSRVRETAYHTKDLNDAIETLHALNLFHSER